MILLFFSAGNDTILDEVQTVVSNYERNLLLASFVPRILFCVIAGPWSDRHKRRKPIIALPILGQVI